jgi:hypothetical protein
MASLTFNAVPAIGRRRWADVERQIGCGSDGSCHLHVAAVLSYQQRVELVLVGRERNGVGRDLGDWVMNVIGHMILV